MSISPEIQSVMDRVAKLLQLASKNTNEHEAAAAAQKAQDLLTAYNLDMAAIERDGGKGTGSARREDQKYAGGLYLFQRNVWTAVARLNFCMYWNHKDHGKKEVKYKHWDGTMRTRMKHGFKFQHRVVGRTVNVAATQAMAEYVLGAIERLTRERLHNNGSLFFTEWAMSYREGMADRVIEKINDRRREVLDAEARRKAETEAAVRASARPGEGMGTAISLSTYIDSETDANLDFLYGEGWSAGRAAKRAEQAAARAAADAEYTRWAEAHPEEARVKEAEAAKERAKASRGSAGRTRYVKDASAYYAGFDKGNDISLDPQMGDGTAGKIGSRK